MVAFMVMRSPMKPRNRPLDELRRIPLFPPLVVDTFVVITFFLQGEREAGELPAVDPPRHAAHVSQRLLV